MKKTCTLLLLLLLLLGCSGAAWATPVSYSGWESWQGYRIDDGYHLYCPVDGLPYEQLYAYLNKIMEENSNPWSSQYSVFELRFSYSQRAAEIALVREEIDRSYQLYFGERDTYKVTSGASWVTVTLTVNPPEDAYTRELQRLAAAARAASDSKRGQLAYLNRYLFDHVAYDRTHARPDRYTGQGALLSGYAVCEGYTAALGDLCNLLDIPNTKIVNLLDDHVWNCVYLDGAWKMIDATWSGSNDNPELFFLVDEIVYPADWPDEYIHSYDADLVKRTQASVLQLYGQRSARADKWAFLQSSDLLRGDNQGNLNLNAGLTRAELATVLVRLQGAEAQVQANEAAYAALCVFADVPVWAQPYVGYCVSQGLLTGYTSTLYGAGDAVTPQAACTVALRQLGQAETDWSYDTAITKAQQLGLVPVTWPTGRTVLRNDLLGILYQASLLLNLT